ncbi:kelch repeat protein [Teladorsagia circumcincta]|uniref:Kelch repeat protein n=1 Tax=Teladorsagia circumcincta TaxID=45464 RepID=A0A2G9UFA6_TELCI|nr:kelch repeat protein [Teladorsagia circumcincta]
MPPVLQMVMFGGWHTGRTHSRIDIFDQDKHTWKPLCDLSLVHPIAYHGSVVLNDHTIANLAGSLQKLLAGIPANDVLAQVHHGRTYISNSCCVLDGLIYVCGGFDVRGIHQRRRNDRLRCVERYDPKTNKWERIPSMIQMRSDAAAVSAGGKLYVSGGFNGTEIYYHVLTYDPVGVHQWRRWAQRRQQLGDKYGVEVHRGLRSTVDQGRVRDVPQHLLVPVFVKPQQSFSKLSHGVVGRGGGDHTLMGGSVRAGSYECPSYGVLSAVRSLNRKDGQ